MCCCAIYYILLAQCVPVILLTKMPICMTMFVYLEMGSLCSFARCCTARTRFMLFSFDALWPLRFDYLAQWSLLPTFFIERMKLTTELNCKDPINTVTCGKHCDDADTAGLGEISLQIQLFFFPLKSHFFVQTRS